MSANLYDDAIVKKLQDLLPQDSGIHVLKPEETARLFEEKADMSHDHMTLPIIGLSRKGFTIMNPNAQPKSRDGIKIRAYDKNGKLINDGSVFTLNAIPIQLNYQLDIYTLKLDECENYAREFIFQLVNYPTGEVFIPYNDVNVTHKFKITLETEVEDNSDIPMRTFSGQFTRYTLSFIVDDAYLFSVPNKTIAKIGCAKVVVQDEQSHEIIDETKVI